LPITRMIFAIADRILRAMSGCTPSLSVFESRSFGHVARLEGYDDQGMRTLMQRLGEIPGSGINRIALSTALRGTLATGLPLAVLPHLGLGRFAYPAVLGALAVSLVDVGGPYRTRLLVMLAQALGGPCLLELGSIAAIDWWVAAPVMAAIGVLSGLVRALGPGGASLGTNTAIAFLVGLQIGSSHEAVWAVGYGIGGLWTIVVTLAFWQLRPYRRLEQEVAGAWQTVASLLTAVDSAADGGVVMQRRREQRIAAAHAAARTAIEQSKVTLGQLRAGTAGPGTTIAQLVLLLDFAANIVATAIALCEMRQHSAAQPSAAADLARGCHAVAHVLLTGHGELPLAELHRRLDEVRSSRHGQVVRTNLLAWAQGVRSLDNAEEAIRLLFGTRHRLPNLLRLPFEYRLPRGAVMDALRTHATPRSAIFRHAMRVASVTAVDTAMLAYFRLPHGIWLPLTSLAILQPDYGGTITRAVQRSLGTISGAVIAGILLATVHGTGSYDAAIGVLLFATFLLIRRNYGYGITFLTPIIILLIGMSSLNPWVDLAERVAYTIVGALLALAAGYLLWPQWERDQLRDRLAHAIDADRVYVDAVLQALSNPSVHAPSLPVLRREAEMAIANADAGFQRMRGEPGSRTTLLAVGFALLIYLHRLCRHAIALAEQLDAASTQHESIEHLRNLINEVLEDVRRVISEDRPPVPWPSIDPRLAELAAQLTREDEYQPGGAVATLLGRLIGDLKGLLSATGYARSGQQVSADFVPSQS
jgi:uncharacterized membrane protein YccC